MSNLKSENNKHSEINIKDLGKIKRLYTFFQPSIFIVIYSMYFASYLCRKSLSVAFRGPNGFAANMGFSTWEAIDIFSSLGVIYNTTYAVGKFLGGFLADKVNNRIFLPIFIIISSILSAGFPILWFLHNFSILNSINDFKNFMYIIWGLTALTQGAIYPMCAKILVYWYSNKNLVYVFSLFSTSITFGSSCSMILSGIIMEQLDWKSIFIIPSLIGLFTALIGIFIIRNKPTDCGLPDSETYYCIKHKTKYKNKDIKKKSEDKKEYWILIKKDILKNKNFWAFSLTYVCVYMLLTGFTDWLPGIFMDGSAKFSPVMATLPLTILSICGPIGSLSIPAVSEKMFCGKRSPAIFFYMLISTIGVIILRLIINYNGNAILTLPYMLQNIVLYIVMILIGIGIYGTQHITGGMAALECGSKKIASTITGVVGSMGYIGSILIMFLGKFTKIFGYQFLNDVWIIAGIIGMLLMLYIWNKEISNDYFRNS